LSRTIEEINDEVIRILNLSDEVLNVFHGNTYLSRAKLCQSEGTLPNCSRFSPLGMKLEMAQMEEFNALNKLNHGHIF
jgi:hypothetical protein